MRKLIVVGARALAVAFVVVIAATCSLFSVDVAVSAQAVDGANATGIRAQSIDMGGGLIVTGYDVTFYRIEVGNSEEDKFTLWEDTAGVSQDLVASVSFADVEPAARGTYQYMRLTIGDEIGLSGTDSGVAGTATATVTGQSTDAAGNPRFVFGTEAVNATGTFLLAEEITISGGASFSLTFDIEGTVSTGPLALTPPVITFVAE